MKKKLIVIGIIIMFLVGLCGCNEQQIDEDDEDNGSDESETEEEPEVTAQMFYVGGVGSNNYSIIQFAINDASDGDTVYVYSGTYYENVKVNKSIKLIGENEESTIIDGDTVDDVVYISAESVTINGFTIQHSKNELMDRKSGIKVRRDNAIITNITVKLNGNGIQTYLSDNHTIKNNYIIGNFEGISVQTSDNNVISDNIITSNDNTGVFCYNSDKITISNNNFSNNKDSIDLSVTNLSVITNNNILPEQSGIGLIYSYNNVVSYNTISSGIYAAMGVNRGSYNVFYGNTISDNGGAGLSFATDATNNIAYHNNFINNYENAYNNLDNTWYNETLEEGNYWSDYTGVDADDDGIGDTPYNILNTGDEYSGYQDIYPLINQFEYHV